jgi:hypothetical protein
MSPLILLAAGALAQQVQSFTISLQGSVAEATPLFDPVREAEWAGQWKPHFLNPPDGGQRAGLVFTTQDHQGRERIWVVTEYDAKQGRVSYVFVTPGFAVTTLKIRLQPDGHGRSKAIVTYYFSAMVPEANGEVNQHNRQWARQQRIHWETAINAALAKGRQS